MGRGANLLLRSRLHPTLWQACGWVTFGAVLYFGFTGTIRPARNLATVVTWSLWWPILPFLLILLGRAWCAVCPIGSVADLMGRLGLQPDRMPGIYFRRFGVWAMLFSFTALTWADRVFGVVASPRATAWLLLIMLAGAAGMALIYSRRAWCRYVCPLGALIGLYSMAAPLELRARRDTCRNHCRSHDCYSGNASAPGCPLYEYPMAMESNRNCSLCGNCVKACPHGSVSLRLRPPLQDFWKLPSPVLGESMLAVLMVALVFIQTFDMTVNYAGYMRWFMTSSGISNWYVAFTVTLVGSIALALVLYGLASLVSSRLGGRPVKEHLIRFGYAYAILALAAHLAHNLAHVIGEGGNAVQTVAVQLGLRAAAASQESMGMTGMGVWPLAVVLAGLAGSIYTTFRIARREGERGWVSAFNPHAVLLVAMGLVFVFTFLLPMNPRHSH